MYHYEGCVVVKDDGTRITSDDPKNPDLLAYRVFLAQGGKVTPDPDQVAASSLAEINRQLDANDKAAIRSLIADGSVSSDVKAAYATLSTAIASPVLVANSSLSASVE